jgi:hypothetical protein
MTNIEHKTDDMYNRYRIVHEQDIREDMEQAERFLAILGHHTDSELSRSFLPFSKQRVIILHTETIFLSLQSR